MPEFGEWVQFATQVNHLSREGWLKIASIRADESGDFPWDEKYLRYSSRELGDVAQQAYPTPASIPENPRGPGADDVIYSQYRKLALNDQAVRWAVAVSLVCEAGPFNYEIPVERELQVPLSDFIASYTGVPVAWGLFNEDDPNPEETSIVFEETDPEKCLIPVGCDDVGQSYANLRVVALGIFNSAECQPGTANILDSGNNCDEGQPQVSWQTGRFDHCSLNLMRASDNVITYEGNIVGWQIWYDGAMVAENLDPDPALCTWDTAQVETPGNSTRVLETVCLAGGSWVNVSGSREANIRVANC